MARNHTWTKGYRGGLGRQTWVQKAGWMGRALMRGARERGLSARRGDLVTHGPQPDIRGRLEGESRGNWGQQDQGSQMDRCRGGAAEGQDSETGTV